MLAPSKWSQVLEQNNEQNKDLQYDYSVRSASYSACSDQLAASPQLFQLELLVPGCGALNIKWPIQHRPRSEASLFAALIRYVHPRRGDDD